MARRASVYAFVGVQHFMKFLAGLLIGVQRSFQNGVGVMVGRLKKLLPGDVLERFRQQLGDVHMLAAGNAI